MTTHVAVGLLCLALTVVGCSAGDQEPDPLPPVTTSSPSPVDLPMPSEAAAETPEGAAAFARYYFEMLNHAFRTGDAGGVKRLSEPGCEGCNNLIGAIEKEGKPGERVEGGDYSIVYAESPPIENGDVVVEVRYALAEVLVTATDGRVIETIPANPGIDAQLRLIRNGETWLVRGFRNVVR